MIPLIPTDDTFTCRWALGCISALKEAPWSPELLAHELAEAVEGHHAGEAGASSYARMASMQAGGGASSMHAAEGLLYRGLRIKVRLRRLTLRDILCTTCFCPGVL